MKTEKLERLGILEKEKDILKNKKVSILTIGNSLTDDVCHNLHDILHAMGIADVTIGKMAVDVEDWHKLYCGQNMENGASIPGVIELLTGTPFFHGKDVYDQLKQIFQGQIYQLWAQMLCLREMGYEVESLSFYEISTNKTIPVTMPTEPDILRFSTFIERFRAFDPAKTPFSINPNKCRHCVYCNFCDKTIEDNVYT